MQIHTIVGIFDIDTDTVTDKDLENYGSSRAEINALLTDAPRDVLAELDALKAELQSKGIIS